MTSFRWILLLLGLLVLGLIFFLGNRRAGTSKRKAPGISSPGKHTLAAATDTDIEQDLQDLGTHIRINDNDFPADEAAAKTGEARESSASLQAGELIHLILMAPEGEYFSGNQVLHAVTQAGMEYGDKRIFHYRESMSDKNPWFSIANILEPGWFDIEGINEFQTPGIVIFMQVPNDHGTVRAFDCMVEKATQLSHMLRGHLLDASRSSLTPQTISHTREQLISARR